MIFSFLAESLTAIAKATIDIGTQVQKRANEVTSLGTRNPKDRERNRRS